MQKPERVEHSIGHCAAISAELCLIFVVESLTIVRKAVLLVAPVLVLIKFYRQLT